MKNPDASQIAVVPASAKTKFAGSIWTLILIAPLIAEVLSGSTRTSILFVYVPEVMVWGIGALLCRDLARRWRAGWMSLLCLGLALSVAEEFLIQQTSIAPLPFPGAHADYGRIWGVNLVYFLFMLGFESVWVVLVPVEITELFFPERSGKPWLRRRGAVIAVVLFLLGCRVAWYGWTQQARPRLNAAPYNPSPGMLAMGAGMIALLVAMAYGLRGKGGRRAIHGRITGRSAGPAWLAGLLALGMGFLWFNVIGQVFVPKPVQPFWVAVAAGAVWGLLAMALFGWWSSRGGWGRAHDFAAAGGALVGCMAAPYLTISSWPRVDVIGIVVFDVFAIAGMVVLGMRIRSRATVQAG